MKQGCVRELSDAASVLAVDPAALVRAGQHGWLSLRGRDSTLKD